MMALLQISEPEPPRRVVGIDLGTTYSLVARPLGAGKAEVIGDPDNSLLPSTVAWSADGQVLTGERGEGFIRSAKRMIGRALTELPSGLAERLLQGPQDTVLIETPAGPRSPVEVSAEILRALAKRACDALDGPLDGAVITVPAFFNDAQRQATRDAARIAGIQVLRLLNEPTAAALAYGLNREQNGKTLLVYDFGGGTFDVSILYLTEGVFEVRSTAGDTHLGGDDLDRALGEHIAEQVGKPVPPHQLLTLAQRVKEQLSERERTEVSLYGWQGAITRDQLEAIARPVLERTLSICKEALTQAKLQPSDIDDVVLVGGSTRMPLVSEMVQTLFKRPPHRDIDPDRVVAMGAAVHAGILTGIDASDTVLLDVTPLSLGVETAGELVDTIIPRNTPIPVKRQQEFTTAKDAQTGMVVHVLQGESSLAQSCRSLGRFTLKGLPPLAAGMARVRIEYSVDADGILQVEATEDSTGIRAGIEVTPAHGLTEDDILVMLRNSGAENEQREAQLRALCFEAGQLAAALHKALNEDGQLLNADEKTSVETALGQLQQAIDENDSAEIISQALENMENAAEEFSQRRMDARIVTALAGRHKDQI